MKATSVGFFLTVSPPPPAAVAGHAVAAALGVSMLWMDPVEPHSGLSVVLLIQMFGASTGFTAAASRGHFDPLLVSGASRASIAAGHCVAAALPGLAAWGILALAEMVLALPGGRLASQPGSVLALLFVSVVAWAVGLALPRFAGGVLWMVVLVVVVASRTGFLGFVDVISASDVSSPDEVLRVGAAMALCPFLLLGDSAAARSWQVHGLLVVAALAAAAAGFQFIARRDYPLAEAP
jgi:hypothetical protein